MSYLESLFQALPGNDFAAYRAGVGRWATGAPGDLGVSATERRNPMHSFFWVHLAKQDLLSFNLFSKLALTI